MTYNNISLLYLPQFCSQVVCQKKNSIIRITACSLNALCHIIEFQWLRPVLRISRCDGWSAPAYSGWRKWRFGNSHRVSRHLHCRSVRNSAAKTELEHLQVFVLNVYRTYFRFFRFTYTACIKYNWFVIKKDCIE